MEEGHIAKLRKEALIHCDGQPDTMCFGTCLYDIFEDPCETTDISEKYPEVSMPSCAKLRIYFHTQLLDAIGGSHKGLTRV